MIHTPDIDTHRDDGSYIRTLRLICNFTQKQWAAKFGVTTRQVSKWESEYGYSYPVQYLAESLVRSHICQEIAIQVAMGGGDKRGIIVAQTLYLSDRLLPAEAIKRGIKYSKDNPHAN